MCTYEQSADRVVRKTVTRQGSSTHGLGRLLSAVVLAMISVCRLAAQSDILSPDQVRAALEKDLRGRESLEGPGYSSFPIPIKQMSAATVISVASLRHKVPNDARRTFRLATKLSRTGDYTKAIAELEKATRLDPEFVDAHTLLGVDHALVGAPMEAQREFQRVIELVPQSPLAHYNLAVFHYQLGQAPAALESVGRALDLAPTDARANLLLGMLLWSGAAPRSEVVQRLEVAARTLPEARSALRRYLKSSAGQ